MISSPDIDNLALSLYDITYIIMYNKAAIYVSRLLQLDHAEAAGGPWPVRSALL